MAYSNTLAVIRQYVSGAVGDLILGQCGTTGATLNKIYAPFLWKPNDYYNDHRYEVYGYAGTNVGANRRVTDWVLADLLLTVHAVYNDTSDATSYIELHYIFTEDEYRKAINLAIESADSYLIDKIDETITLVASTYEYTVSSGMDYVHRVITEGTADTGDFFDSDEIDPRNWELISPRTLKLVKAYYSPTAGKDLRVEGQGKQAILTADNDICYLPPDWLVQKAITFLPQNKIQSNKLDNTYRQALAISSIEPRVYPNPRGRRVVE